jgi:putative Mg2+ transporter-C (MgtC) family protein
MAEDMLFSSGFLFAADFAVKLVLAFVIGFVIGLERESRGKDAGISTHALVIMGAMLFTYISSLDSESSSRIAAQIVTGIGFLGAGLILRDGTTVRNLTTAASLWFAAAIGMAIGYEYYSVAIVSAIAAVLVPRIPHVLERIK